MFENGIIDIIKYSLLLSLSMFVFVLLNNTLLSVIVSVYKGVFGKGKFIWYYNSILDRYQKRNETYRNFSGLFKRIIKACLRTAAFGFVFALVIFLYQYIVLKYDHKI